MQRDQGASKKHLDALHGNREFNRDHRAALPHPANRLLDLAPRVGRNQLLNALARQVLTRAKKAGCWDRDNQDAAVCPASGTDRAKAWNMALELAVVCQISSSFRMCSETSRRRNEVLRSRPAISQYGLMNFDRDDLSPLRSRFASQGRGQLDRPTCGGFFPEPVPFRSRRDEVSIVLPEIWEDGRPRKSHSFWFTRESPVPGRVSWQARGALQRAVEISPRIESPTFWLALAAAGRGAPERQERPAPARR